MLLHLQTKTISIFHYKYKYKNTYNYTRKIIIQIIHDIISKTEKDICPIYKKANKHIYIVLQKKKNYRAFLLKKTSFFKMLTGQQNFVKHVHFFFCCTL